MTLPIPQTGSSLWRKGSLATTFGLAWVLEDARHRRQIPSRYTQIIVNCYGSGCYADAHAHADDDDDDDDNDHSIALVPTASFIVSIAQGQRSWKNVLRCIPHHHISQAKLKSLSSTPWKTPYSISFCCNLQRNFNTKKQWLHRIQPPGLS